MLQFFNWFKKNKQKKEETKVEVRDISELYPIPEDLPEPEVGQKIKVLDPDQARAEIAMRALMSGKMIVGSAEWNEDGTGEVKIEGVEDAPK